MAAEHVQRIGTRIRERREELGLSRRALVQAMEGSVTENDIYRWERGQHRPQDDTLSDIARALNVDVSRFLVAEPEAGETPDLMGELGEAQDVMTVLLSLTHEISRIREQLDRLERRDEESPPDEETG